MTIEVSTAAIATAGIGAAGWIIQLIVSQFIKDRQSRRATREREASTREQNLLEFNAAQVRAFDAHVKECTDRALTHARMESKVNEIGALLEERREKVDQMYEATIRIGTMLDAHLKSDEHFQERIEGVLERVASA